MISIHQIFDRSRIRPHISPGLFPWLSSSSRATAHPHLGWEPSVSPLLVPTCNSPQPRMPLLPQSLKQRDECRGSTASFSHFLFILYSIHAPGNVQVVSKSTLWQSKNISKFWRPQRRGEFTEVFSYSMQHLLKKVVGSSLQLEQKNK